MKPQFSAEDRKWAQSLPKSEIHAHINGSVSLEDLRALAASNNQVFPDNLLLPGDPSCSLSDVFSLFSQTIYKFVRTRSDLSFVVECVLKAFKNDGCTYVELRSTPKKSEYLDIEEYVCTVLDAISAFAQSPDGSGMKVRLLLSVDRRHGPETAELIVDLAVSYKQQERYTKYIVGIDVCGDPNVGGIKHLIPALTRAKREGLNLVIHFAEVENPPEEGELEAMLNLNPDRLGHCTFVPLHMWDEIIARKIPLEICLTSNVLTGTVEEYSRHHLRYLWHERGYRELILCTDDRGIFMSELSEEYLTAKEILGLTKQEMENWARSVVRYQSE
ncbi:adenosine deaminase-like protein [Obelidium mucronatum]|nr:adenosine deaminase-like protein [Obelidium mucronatum]